MWKSLLFVALLTINWNLAIDATDDRRELPTADIDKEEIMTATKNLLVLTTESTVAEDAQLIQIVDSFKDKYRGFIWDDVTKYLIALKYEAKKLGVTPLEYLKSCENPILLSVYMLESPLTIVKQFVAGWDGTLIDKYSIDFFNINYNESSQILELLEQNSPDDYKMFNEDLQLFKTNYLDKLDPAAQKYIQRVGQAILEMVVTLTFSSRGGHIPRYTKDYEASSDLLMCDYDYTKLPQFAQDNIERVFCVRPAIAMAVPGLDTNFQFFLRRVRGQYINEMSEIREKRKEAIYEEEAEKLGITVPEHRENCEDPLVANIIQYVSAGSPASGFTSFGELDIVLPEYFNFSKIRFNRSSEVVEKMKLSFPNMFAILDRNYKLLKTSHMDNTTRAFVHKVGEGILEKFALQSPTKTITEMNVVGAEIMEKLITDYKSLPQKSKDDLEKGLCAHTILRILEGEQRDFSAILEHLKNRNIVHAIMKLSTQLFFLSLICISICEEPNAYFSLKLSSRSISERIDALHDRVRSLLKHNYRPDDLEVSLEYIPSDEIELRLINFYYNPIDHEEMISSILHNASTSLCSTYPRYLAFDKFFRDDEFIKGSIQDLDSSRFAALANVLNDHGIIYEKNTGISNEKAGFVAIFDLSIPSNHPQSPDFIAAVLAESLRASAYIDTVYFRNGNYGEEVRTLGELKITSCK